MTFERSLGGAGQQRGRAGMCWLAVAAAAALVAGAVRLQAQEPLRLWAAQTGPDQATLVWGEVPGAAEYRIHSGDPDGAGSPAARRPLASLGASSRQAVLPLRRITAGLWLVPVGSDGRPLGKAPFNPVTPVRGVRPVGPPASATATVTGAEEVTLSWDPVPNATGYMILRAVQPNGFQMFCALCSTEPTYVDRDVTPGAVHSYAVAAIYPGGTSPRTTSNSVTPGATAIAAEATAGPAHPLPMLPTTTAQRNPGAPTYTPPTQPAGTAPTYTPPGQPAGGTPTYTPPGQPVATSPSGAAPAHPSTPGGAAPVTTPSTTPSGTVGPAVPPDTVSVAGLLQAEVLASAHSLLDVFGPGTVSETHSAAAPPAPLSPAAQMLAQALEYARGIARQFGPKFQATGQPVDTSSIAGQILLQAQEYAREIGQLTGSAFGGQSTQPHAATPVYSGPCRLDYQRADNMWAAFGRPDGQLGVETITLADGQTKAFITDWKYEKRRNDGTTYYGSHMRSASNPGQRPVTIEFHSLVSTAANLLGAIARADSHFTLSLAPGKTQLFQADLVAASCTN